MDKKICRNATFFCVDDYINNRKICVIYWVVPVFFNSAISYILETFLYKCDFTFLCYSQTHTNAVFGPSTESDTPHNIANAYCMYEPSPRNPFPNLKKSGFSLDFVFVPIFKKSKKINKFYHIIME